MSLPLTNKAKLVNLYKKENDPKVKERLFLVIRVIEDGQVPFRVVKEMNRSNPWASEWLKRYDKEGVEGLKDRPKIGRSPELSEGISYQIRKELKESSQGWTTKQVEELIVEKSGIKYHYTHTYTASSASGASSRRCQERFMLTQHLKKKRMISKKGHPDTCG